MSYFQEVIKQMREEQVKVSDKIPSLKLTIEFIDECIEYIFPVYARYLNCDLTDEGCLYRIESNLNSILLMIKDRIEGDIKDISRSFIRSFPTVYRKLIKDAQAIQDFDPASNSLAEIIVSYPGFYAIVIYRLSHELVRLGVPVLPRLISEHAHSKTGIDINPGAQIGESFFIDHGTGVVIGETCVIHDNVKIYQGVTLGAASVSKDLANVKRHPTVEDNVIIYSNATILGGDTCIGHDSVIGGNVWLTTSVDPYSLVFNRNETTIKSKNKVNSDPILNWSYEI